MHFFSIFFHSNESDITELMRPYNYENEEEQEFEVAETQEKMQKLYNKLPAKEKKLYKNLDDFAKEGYGYDKDEEGDYGNYGNSKGCYDWYREGGRWEGQLIWKGAKESRFKKIQDAEVKPKKFKTDLPEYMRLKMMSPFEYCNEKNKVGKTSLPLAEVDWEATMNYIKSWMTSDKVSRPGDCFFNYFCENDGFIDKDPDAFDELLKYWGDRKDAVVTIIDYHS